MNALIPALGLHPLYELSCIVSLIGLLKRDQLILRALLLVVYALHIVDDLFDGPSVATEYAIWNSVFFSINLYVLCDLVYARTTLWFSLEERKLFDLLGGLSPGDFRKLMKSSRVCVAESETALTREGATLDKLYYIYEGAVTIAKGDRETPLEPQTFIGEIAFLKRGVASASVCASPQTRWIEWPAPALRKQLDRDKGLRMVVMRLIGEDLAEKVARA